MYVFICIWSGDVRADHNWSLGTNVKAHSNARCELSYLELATCEHIIKCKTHVDPRYEQMLSLTKLQKLMDLNYVPCPCVIQFNFYSNVISQHFAEQGWEKPNSPHIEKTLGDIGEEKVQNTEPDSGWAAICLHQDGLKREEWGRDWPGTVI